MNAQVKLLGLTDSDIKRLSRHFSQKRSLKGLAVKRKSHNIFAFFIYYFNEMLSSIKKFLTALLTTAFAN